eukprot:scaffold33831_cov32-Tisochrysis_lutea.AAC.1
MSPPILVLKKLKPCLTALSAGLWSASSRVYVAGRVDVARCAGVANPRIKLATSIDGNVLLPRISPLASSLFRPRLLRPRLLLLPRQVRERNPYTNENIFRGRGSITYDPSLAGLFYGRGAPNKAHRWKRATRRNRSWALWSS